MLGRLPTRKTDKYGSGAYLAPRGDRLHQGVDLACYPGTHIMSLVEGTVTKIGYPYNPNTDKGYLRYVEVTTDEDLQFRYFYVKPTVKVGDRIEQGTVLGISQQLGEIYGGITEHVHLEVKLHGEFLSPMDFLQEDV